MTNEILTPQFITAKKFRRFRIYRLTSRPHQPRQRSPEECIQRWEKEARRRQYLRSKTQIDPDSSTVAKGREAEQKLANWLRSQGYEVELTPNNESFDLVINSTGGNGCEPFPADGTQAPPASIIIEVKCSHWNEQTDRTRPRPRYRYQWRIHPAQVGKSNLVACLARNGDDHWLVIPTEVLGQQKSITIRTFDLLAYRGKWSPYLEAWELLEAALAVVREEEVSQ